MMNKGNSGPGNLKMSNVCVEIYKTVVKRAEHEMKTQLVKMPPALYIMLADDEIKWLKNVLNVSVSEADVTEPEFLERFDS